MATHIIIGNSLVTVTSNAILSKHKVLQANSSASLIIITSTSVLFKHRQYIASLSSSNLTIISDSLPKLISESGNEEVLSRTYECTITGANNGLSDLIIPISSIGLQLDGITLNSSMLIVCPDGNTYGSDIAARKDGTIKIVSTDFLKTGAIILVTVLEHNIATVILNNGSKNYSVNLNGIAIIQQSSFKSYNAKTASYIATDPSGNNRYRLSIISEILPGDKLLIPGFPEVTVGRVAININPTVRTMEITADG